jgi:flagellar FliJ protein
MTWAQSLIKLSTYEVETLQKRLADICAERQRLEMRLACLDAEGEAEHAAAQNADTAWRIVGYLQALELRKGRIRDELHTVAVEERGARDALGQAFETQKKYEQVAEQARLIAAKEAGRRETAQLDEIAMRKMAAGGR